MYISNTDQLISKGNGPAVRMVAGVACEVPAGLVEAALAAGAQLVGEKVAKKTTKRADPPPVDDAVDTTQEVETDGDIS